MITATVPEGMSYVNAWHALWEKAEPTSSSAENKLSTSQKVERFFQMRKMTYFSPYVMGNAGGKRMMKVDFCDFPLLDVFHYDVAYGAGAAQSALDQYNKVAPEKRFDKNDSCKFSDI